MTTRWFSPKCLIYTTSGVLVLIIVTLIVSLVHQGSSSPQPHPGTPPSSSIEAVIGAGDSASDVFGRTSGTASGSDARTTVISAGVDYPGEETTIGRVPDDLNVPRRPLDGNASAPTNDTNISFDDGIPRLHDPSKSDVVYIKPTKILVQPLHADDLLYDSKTADTDIPGAQIAPKFHRTGLFRNRSSRIWDPHPEYKIDAFGITMHVILWHDRSFMPEDVKVTHVWPNETLRKPDDHWDHAGLQGCFYKGRVVGDEKSTVAVSLCEGMRGHIRTSRGSFFIEPVEKYSNEDTNIWHALSRERTPEEGGEVDAIDAIGDVKQDVNDSYIESVGVTSRSLVPTNERAQSRVKRSTAHITNNEYTIEVLVAVDKKMQEYHGDTLKSYVLTLMSIVSSIYADASIGNSIKIAVVHILYLHQDLAAHSTLDRNGSKGVSASEMLQAFCRSKQASNFHHDTALLLTREQICRHRMKCDTLGLAELGTMCKRSSCAIVQDNGLSAAFTIAHELGHVLSMPHDDDVRCGPFRGENSGKQNIMSRMLDHNTHPWSWSNCSRHFVTEYLEQNRANCMLDKPTTDLIEPSTSHTKLAGEKFTDDQQCELVFGNGSRICSYMPVCERLWCNNGDELKGCRTQHMPWADGTSCGDNQWCQKGLCVDVNRQALQPQDGGWGQWSSFSECSRSCGGGVQISTRICDSPPPANGGKYCTGMRMQYRSCNVDECAEGTLDFREEQCHELDGNNFEIPGLEKNVKWIPKYGVKAEDQCKLYCRVKNSNNYFLLRDKVKDGTPCTHPHEGYDMCINGQCRTAGCDYVFDSDAKLDKCGHCRGNNDTCSDVNGVFPFSKIHHMKKPYVQKIVRIPTGATNIEIIQRGYKDDGNYLALRDENNEYIFNSPKTTVVSGFRKRLFAGVMLEYNGPDEPIEIIRSDFGKPLRRDLIVEIYSHSKMRAVSENFVEYSFTIPTDLQSMGVSKVNSSYVQHYPSQNSIPSYQWKMSDWSECDQSCSGKRHRTAECYDIETGKEKPISYCRNSAKPREDYEPCNTECKFEWEATSSECSNSCGEGVKNVQYQCVQQYIKSHQTNPVDPTYCSNIRKPNNLEKCHGPCPDATWSYTDWEPCSRTCGGGKQNRTVSCLSSPDGFRISDGYCAKQPKEETYRRCNTDSCPEWVTGELTPQDPPAYAYSGEETKPISRLDSNYYSATHMDVSYQNTTTQPYKWCTSVWSICNAKCNGGVKQRKVQCCFKYNESVVVDDLYCQHDKKPSAQTNCGNFRCPQWNFGQWGECNDDCKRYRQVLCQDHRGKESNECPLNQKPPEVESCCHFKWRITNWKPCNVTCGGGDGYRTGERVCMRLFPKSTENPHPVKTGRKVDAKHCAHVKTPPAKKLVRKCKPCQFRWEVSPWSKCSVGCGTGLATRNVTCSNGRTIASVCDVKHKPSNVKPCETHSFCRWSTARWNRCKCDGFQRRNVKCYDELTKTESNRCPEPRPMQKKKCTPAPDCRPRYSKSISYTCQDIQRSRRIRQDGEYTLNIKGRPVSIYCHNMTSNNPTEYLTLKSGIVENYAIYINKRAANAGFCSQSSEDWVDNSIIYGATHYRKIRLNIHTLKVIEDDHRFTDRSGTPQGYGSAGDCYSNTGKCPQGDFSINLENTPFRIRPHTEWETKGQNAVIHFLIPLAPPYKKVRARCGGYCGSCSVSRSNGLFLEMA
ncbi:A disintegrin and metalloproteinase with thrombospondin motifs 20 isoform X2 [Toxorhynchites rutilus septentrionalis]|uniref:A disintegrin and metalloproteinase with thrombospondin motifs 20 isoform X2 n=1 Tax=Toxorhynchites rutilus septentrionalis TaxID=329112 RepID=UPI0024789ACF|nr:A disintegrin and metalloproteinase with thrombospondin motifs 20 isoform X2 [Toxorhynchites rutilus septentrionalis]